MSSTKIYFQGDKGGFANGTLSYFKTTTYNIYTFYPSRPINKSAEEIIAGLKSYENMKDYISIFPDRIQVLSPIEGDTSELTKELENIIGVAPLYTQFGTNIIVNNTVEYLLKNGIVFLFFLTDHLLQKDKTSQKKSDKKTTQEVIKGVVAEETKSEETNKGYPPPTTFPILTELSESSITPLIDSFETPLFDLTEVRKNQQRMRDSLLSKEGEEYNDINSPEEGYNTKSYNEMRRDQKLRTELYEKQEELRRQTELQRQKEKEEEIKRREELQRQKEEKERQEEEEEIQRQKDEEKKEKRQIETIGEELVDLVDLKMQSEALKDSIKNDKTSAVKGAGTDTEAILDRANENQKKLDETREEYKEIEKKLEENVEKVLEPTVKTKVTNEEEEEEKEVELKLKPKPTSTASIFYLYNYQILEDIDGFKKNITKTWENYIKDVVSVTSISGIGNSFLYIVGVDLASYSDKIDLNNAVVVDGILSNYITFLYRTRKQKYTHPVLKGLVSLRDRKTNNFYSRTSL